MKNVLIILSLLMVSCGKDKTYHDEDLIVKTVTEKQALEGVYKCGENSYLKLVADHDGLITFDTSVQTLNSVNPGNETFGTHPTISDRNVPVRSDGTMFISRNFGYSSSTSDIEEDISGDDITGTRRTDITLEESMLGLDLTIKIWAGAVNSNINEIVALRSFSCELL